MKLQVLVVEFHIHSPHVDEFASAIEANACTSLKDEPGCRQFDVCRDPAQPQLFYLYELYDDEAAIQAHLASAHFQHFNALTAAWVASKRVQRLERVVG